MIILKIFRILLSKIRNQKTDFFLRYKYFEICKNYGRKCLDIGAGSGRFAKFLLKRGHGIKAIDVVDKSEHPELNLKVFNGKSIPFMDKEFDTSILMFVLHHTDHAAELLKECVRVTSNKIIIGEDIISCGVDRMLGNIHLGTSPWSKSSNGFKTDRAWIQLFSSYNLRLIDSVEIPRGIYPVYPVIRKIYVLEVASQQTILCG
ncbi:MAG: class I SAM-dependent methyltransferase [Cyclobacteriaceae bacterium]